MAGNFNVGEWLVDPSTNTISANNQIKHLEPKVMGVLLYLANHAGKVVTKEHLLKIVWADTFVTEHVLKVAISELRKALGDDAKNPRFIQTIPKSGYRLFAPVKFPEQTRESTDDFRPSLTKHNRARRRSTWPLIGIAAVVLIAPVLILLPKVTFKRFFVSDIKSRKINSVAVLPLRNISGNPEDEFFADGMTDQLITDLARIGSLRVISRMSTMKYKGRAKSLPEIARELNVDAVIEGSVFRSEDRIRITIQLIDAATDQHLWAESYEHDSRNIIALQGSLALSIAKQVKAQVAGDRQLMIATARPVDSQAYEVYLKGRFFWNQRSFEGLRKSIEYFEQAIAKEPAFALAYAGLASAHTAIGFNSRVAPHDSYLKAKEAALKAIELDPSLAEAYAVLGAIKHKYELDWAGAETSFQKAIQLNPGYATAYQWYAIFLMSMARFDEALSHLGKAKELDPLSLIIRVDLGWIMYTAGRYDEAITQLRQTFEMDPRFPGSYFLVLAYAKTGRYDEAIDELNRVIGLKGESATYLSLLGYIQALRGKRKEALKIVGELNRRWKGDSSLPYQFALIYAALGDKEEAIKWLEQIHQERSSWQPFLEVEPELESLRQEPGFQDLLRRIRPTK